ncbi:MAG: hypothetical protein ABWY56_16325 [Propionibacteriaceae bacterium]
MLAAVAVLLCLTPSGAGAMPVTSPPPPLSITVDNGHDASAAGDQRRYTVTVTNDGGSDLKDLVITQSVPAGLTFVSTDGHGAHARQAVTWALDLDAGERTSIHTALTVASTPDTMLRVATVVCAQLTTAGEPIVCASDSDLLPAGALAEVAAAQVDPTTWAEVLGQVWPWLGGAGLVAITAVLLVGRRRATAG